MPSAVEDTHNQDTGPASRASRGAEGDSGRGPTEDVLVSPVILSLHHLPSKGPEHPRFKQLNLSLPQCPEPRAFHLSRLSYHPASSVDPSPGSLERHRPYCTTATEWLNGTTSSWGPPRDARALRVETWAPASSTARPPWDGTSSRSWGGICPLNPRVSFCLLFPL